MPTPTLKCPQCSSEKLYRDGLRRLADGSNVQRWVCKNCGYRFTQPHRTNSDASQHASKVDRQILNCADTLPSNCQGSCEASSGASSARMAVKALTGVQSRSEKRTAGTTAINQTLTEAHGQIVEFLWWMKKQNYAESTIVTRVRVLKVLVKRGANLFDAESVKHVIAQQKWSEGRKAGAVKAYTTFLKMTGGTLQPPICRDVRKIPFIPLEREIDDLIASCNQYIAVFLRIAKETGARAGEIYNLK